MEPQSDTVVIVLAVLSFLTTTITAILAAWIAIRTKETNAIATTTHNLVNSRMTELLEISKSASHAEGVIEGAGVPVSGALSESATKIDETLDNQR